MEDNVKQWVLDNVSTEYNTVLRLLAEQSPDNEPYKSLYAARKVLQEISNKLDKRSGIQGEELAILQGTVLFQLGKNHAECDELSTGEDFLKRALEILGKVEDKVKSVTVYILTCHQLAVLQASRSEHEHALKFLLDAKTSHDNYKDKSHPYEEHELLLGPQNPIAEDKRKEQFERLHTHTLYYLAQTYESLGKASIAASYCFTTLERQLTSRQYDAIDWSLNCATLSQYYLNTDNYKQARHCLACSEHVLTEYMERGEEKDDGIVEKMQQTKADVARCWVKYCIALLRYSQQLKEEGGVQDVLKAREEDFNPFTCIDASSIELGVPCSPVDAFDAARSLFLFGQKCVDSAKCFFSLEWHASDNVSIIQDHSQLFKHLIFFEAELERKCRMYKRRADMMEGLLKQLNPQHYLVLMRQLMFEAGIIYSEMADCKITLAGDSEKPTTHAILKINKLISQSLKHFDSFINSFQDHSGKLPDRFDEQCLRSILSAKFWIARLHSKVVTANPQTQVDHQRKSLENYQWIVAYHKAYPAEVERCFAEELKMCKEMTELLPHKLDKMSLA